MKRGERKGTEEGMNPSKWNFPFAEPSTTISWLNSSYTFQANHCFPSPPLQDYFPYYEVFIISTTGTNKGSVTIGVGPAQVSGKGILPGGKPGSYGYHTNGKVILNAKEYGPDFGAGDVVGCGMTSDNHIYFTKNGKHLGEISTSNLSEDVYPIIGLKYSSISTNFGDHPFLYNPETGETNVLDLPTPYLNDELLLHIFSYLTPFRVLRASRVCKEFYRISKSNQIWKPLVLQKWKHVGPKVPINSFYEFYKHRTKNLLPASFNEKVLVENCFEWEFQCPAVLSKMTRTSDPETDFCSVCNKNVYLVHNIEDLHQRVAAKQCVALDFQNKTKDSRIVDYTQLRGRIVLPHDYVDDDDDDDAWD